MISNVHFLQKPDKAYSDFRSAKSTTSPRVVQRFKLLDRRNNVA